MNRHIVTPQRTVLAGAAPDLTPPFAIAFTLAAAAALLTLPGCFGFGPGDPSPGLQAAYIDVSDGDNQTGARGTTLPDEIVALVRLEGLASAGAPAPNVEVVWRVTGGGGTAVPEVSTTDAQGRARTRWILGPAAGRQTLGARIAGFTSGGSIPEADFVATATTVGPDGPTSGGGGASGGDGPMGGTPGGGAGGHSGPSGPQSPDGATPGAGGAGGALAGTGGAPGTGGASGGGPDGPPSGIGGASGTGGASGAGAGGSAGPPSGPTPGIGGASGAGGAPGPSTCGVVCVFDGPFCHCGTNAADCAQEYRIACPRGAAGNCTCVLNGTAVKTIPGSACDISQLSDPAGCGFPLTVPQ